MAKKSDVNYWHTVDTFLYCCFGPFGLIPMAPDVFQERKLTSYLTAYPLIKPHYRLRTLLMLVQIQGEVFANRLKLQPIKNIIFLLLAFAKFGKHLFMPTLI
jgi:hypothetical protein